MIAKPILLFMVWGLFWAGYAAAQPDAGMSGSSDEGDSHLSLEYLGSFGWTVNHKVRHGKIGVASMGSCIEILDCSDPDHPKLLARRWMRGDVTDMALAGNALYLVIRFGGIRILDLTDPAKPKDRGRYEPEFDTVNKLYGYGLELRNHTLLITGSFGKGYSSLEAVDLGDPLNPKHLASTGGYGSDEQSKAEEEIHKLAGPDQSPDEEEFEYESPFDKVGGIIPVTGNLACAFANGKLCTLDVTDPDKPKILGSLPLKGGDGVVRDRTLIAGNDEGIHFIDLSDPHQPVLISTIEDTGKFGVDWPRALVTSKLGDDDRNEKGNKELTIYDLADLRHPRQSGHFSLPRDCRDFEVADRRCYAACLDLQIINLADPARPWLEGIVRCDDPEEASHSKAYDSFRAREVALCGHYVYCEHYCVDVGNPKIPRIVGQGLFSLPDRYIHERPGPLHVDGKWGIQGVESTDHDEETRGVVENIYDLTDPMQPQMARSMEGVDENAKIVGDRLYLTSSASGVIVFKMKSTTGTQESFGEKDEKKAPAFQRISIERTSQSDFAGLKQIKIAGELACGRVGDRTLLTIDLAKPTQPRLVGRCELPGPFAAMAIDGKYCFAGGTDGTIYTVDLSKPAAPQLRGTFKQDGAPLAMAASKGRLYVAAGKGGLRIIDASAPDKLKELGRYVPEIPCSDLTTSGTMVYLAAKGLEIVDASNPANPQFRYRYPPILRIDGRLLTYEYGPEESFTQEVKKLGNYVYFIGVSSTDFTKCQLLGFYVANPDAPHGIEKGIEAKGQDLDLQPKAGDLRVRSQTQYSGWLLGLPVKAPTVDAARAGLMFYDLTDPGNPVFIGTYEGLTDPRKPVLYKNLVYLADEKLGLVILSREPLPGK